MGESSATPKDNSEKSYSVIMLYKNSWEAVKKNSNQLAKITLIGVGASTLVSVFATFLIINNIAKDIRSALVSILVSLSASILVGVFVSLLQIVSLKKAIEDFKSGFIK